MGSLQRELNSFFTKVQGSDYSIQEVTKGALTQARAKLKPEAFLELNHSGVRDFYAGAAFKIWHTHRLLAIDGSTINLPSHSTTFEEFGEYKVGCNADVSRSMARISLCYDVLNLLTLDARIDSLSVSERSFVRTHIENGGLKAGDLLLLDRGYPSIALMYVLQRLGIEFCIRMQNEWWLEVKAFNDSDLSDKIVEFKLPAKDRHLMQEHNSQISTIKCRLVRVVLENGQHEILCTSLMDEQIYSVASIGELYHLRWNIEEAYKLFKCRAELEAFSGKTATAIKQDFYAKVFMMTMCALLSFPINEKVSREYKESGRKHTHQTNRTNILGFLRESWIGLWMRKKKHKLFESLDHILLKTTEIERKGRSFERKKSRKLPPPMNYKRV